jgi:hypothetical protein
MPAAFYLVKIKMTESIRLLVELRMKGKTE